MNGVIYMYTSPSGKQYIGQTMWPSQRRYQHRTAKDNGVFHNAVRKHGFENMVYTELHSGIKSREVLSALERIEILSRRTIHPYGYNMYAGGDFFEHNKESRKKISNALSGKPKPGHYKATVCYENGRIFESQLAAAKWVGAHSIGCQINKEQKSILGRHFFNLDYEYDVRLIKYSSRTTPVVCVETGRVYKSMRQATFEVSGHYNSTMDRFINRTDRTCHGYHWCTTDMFDEIKSKIVKPRYRCSIKIKCIETGKEYNSVTDASIDITGSKDQRSYISERARKGRAAYGYHFEYI